MSLDAILQAAVDAAVAARIVEMQRPTYVHQRNVEQVVGMPRRDYLRLARTHAFPTMKDGRLVVARTADVVSYYELRIATSAAPAANAGQGSHMARRGWRRAGP